ncbi:MAG: pilus assembly protein PilE [Pseudomonas sp. PGPPP3]|nr:MAG: pilus assembly protein PilE [Pseudomonas sp. PGPPP3]
MQRQKGFTLVELMVVVAIIGILSALVFPSYQRYVMRSGRSEGQAKLMEVMQAQERFYSQNQTYTTNLGVGGLAYPNVAANAAAPSEQARYNVTSAACAGGTIATCVILSAAPQGSQANDTECGTITLNSKGTKTEGGTGTVSTCW